jgi:hypothetical protein
MKILCSKLTSTLEADLNLSPQAAAMSQAEVNEINFMKGFTDAAETPLNPIPSIPSPP